MPTNVIMPQMGESIAEGTLTKWLKKPGDAVKRDEPLFEISTDKVDAEIPAPASGTLLEILVPEGQTVRSTPSSRSSRKRENRPLRRRHSRRRRREDSSKVERAAPTAASPAQAATPAPAPSGESENSTNEMKSSTAAGLAAQAAPPAPAPSQKSPAPPFPGFHRPAPARGVEGGAPEAALVAGRPRDR